MSELIKTLKNLSPEKRELVLQKLKKQQKTPTLQPISREKLIPLSFAQQRLWFINQLEGENCIYNVPFFWQINGLLDINALEKAILEIIKRHEILRTSFDVVNDLPTQIIHTHYALKMEVIDWQNFPEKEQSSQAKQLAIAELQQPFNLSKAPLLRLKLLKLANQSHLLFLVIHHIVCDGWSMDIFKSELLTLYTNFSQNQPASLPKLSLQYADFAQWQREYLQGEILTKQLNYWQQQLAEVNPILQLPTDYPRPSAQSFRGSSQFLQIDRDLAQKLKQLSQDSGTTLFMTLLTVFTLLLSRYSNQEDIVIGSAIANRNRKEIEPLIGFFVNTLALRINLQNNPTFLELLQQVKQVTLNAYDHQDLPFEKLVDELKIERSLYHHPLFQVTFGLQTGKQEKIEIPGLSLTRFNWENTTTLFDLSLIFRENSQGLIGEWEYATDLFKAETIHRMGQHFQVIIKQIIDNPHQLVNNISLLTEDEIQQIQTWNHTQTDYPQDKTFVDLFRQQAEKNPDNLAVVFESKSLTYQQLNAKAEQLANYLITNYEIKPDSLIGIVVERSLEMIIGVLGILKAGAAYVPIDPNYPPERIKFMLVDAGISVLLTQSFLVDNLPLNYLENSVDVIYLDHNYLQTTQQHKTIIKNTINSDNLAYVIYTSGSTGTPKGVMIEHQSLMNLALAWAEICDIKSDSRLFQFVSFSFDVSSGEIAATLAAGACLYLTNQEKLLPNQGLIEFLIIHQITHIFLPPSVLSVLPQAILKNLKHIGVGGETCPPELVKIWGKERKFYNCYGSTETTVNAAIALCQNNNQQPLIGKPIYNYQIYILDQNNQILPPGIPGELCIAGVGLARGYLNRPELTTEKFIEVELFGKLERIYKTGDLAKWNYEGNLEFLGRIDQQIKLRGFRIELGEIEAVLLQHPLVKEAVVILDKNDHHSRLLAYVTHIATSVNISFELQEYLKNCLPDYMIPSQIMVLERFPLTVNGKINKQVLPLPNIDISEQLQIPVTPTEEILANLWQGLLKIKNIKSISREHNFFELGGNSLLATQLITRIRDSFEIELPVRKIFEKSILSELAKAVENATKTINLPPLLPQAENELKNLSFAQSRLWFIAQLENQGSSSTYNMPVAFHLLGNLNITALQQSLTYLLQRHSILRTYFPSLQGEPKIVIRNIEEIEVLEIADLQKNDTQNQAEIIQQLVNNHAQKPFNLNTDCLFRAKLLLLNKDENILLINMHHIISDGWSMGIFKRELEQVYNAYAADATPNLSPLPIQYSDFAVWQRQWLQEEVLEFQENYWRKQLENAPKLLELPTDYPRPAQQSYQGKHEEYYLSKELTQQLKQLSQEQGVTLFMTLLTAFNILLSRYSRQEDLCVGSGIANRTHKDTENLIGLFVNTLVLRSKIDSEKTFIDLLQRTRKTCLDAYAHQDIPFEYLVEKLQPERSLSYNPLCQVMMVLQNMEGVGKKINLTDLNIQQLSQNYPFAKFDLTLYLFDSDEQLYCMWEYATDLFTVDTIKRMAGHFEVLVTAIIQNPQQPIYQLPLITPTEIQKLKTWNQTEINYSEKQTLINLFNEQVQKTPDHFAVVFQSQTLTYQELDHKANQLAHYLINNYQIKADTLIGICVECSLEMIISLVGILKTGAAYVPLDPEYPINRLIFMLEDANVTLILTQKQFTDKFTNDKNRLICLDEIADKILNNSLNQPNIHISENHLANVIYTSGSTGKPKGVMVEHRGIYNLVKSQIKIFDLNSHSRILQFASFSFDAATFEIFMALGTGATLYLATKNSLIPGKPLIEQLNKYKITHITLPPSALAVMPESTLPALQTIIVAGETCALELMQKWSIGRNFFNAYGPTEASVCTSIYQCNYHDKKIAIGKPINNNHVYILDANNQILPPGIPGELCIAGVGLATGYLNRPELTAEKFIHIELFGKNERIYKTGDLAKWDNYGNLHYLGRLDHQVKLRGFRIELSEIEATLLKHKTIREAVVVLRKNSDFDQSLVAYIVPNLTVKNTNTDEFIKLWSDLFNSNYSQQTNPTDDPTLNIAGWNDSYTGKPIPSDVMQEWRDTTVERILELSPKEVWEIGCGSGMLLFKIAPHCQHYLGTDFSTGALKYIERYLKQQSLQEKVTLQQSQANDFTNIQNNKYDVVILNSVIQYFPSIDYLIDVLSGVINSVDYQGKIFIGDVRNLHLLEVSHTATEFYHSSENVSIPQLLENIQKSIRTEEELLIDPDFFVAIQQKFTRITHVEIQLKRGSYHTEMNRFRYDVILYLDQLEINFTQPKCLDWQEQQLSLESIQEILKTQSPDLLHIKNIPNARLSIEIALVENIGQIKGNIKDLQICLQTSNHQTYSGIEPETFHDLITNLPYKIFMQYNSTTLGNYDVILQKNISQQQQIPRFNYQDNYDCKPWQDYANQPWKYQTDNNIDPSLSMEWRNFLNKTLPDYMIPSHFVVLEKLPLTPNGKINRKELPAPNAIITKNNIELPVTETEKFLAQIWVKLLKYDAISRQDNFFNLGGHSLLATQLSYLIRDQFQVDIPLSKIFDLPILSDLAKYIDGCIWVNFSTLGIEPLSADEEEIEF